MSISRDEAHKLVDEIFDNVAGEEAQGPIEPIEAEEVEVETEETAEPRVLPEGTAAHLVKGSWPQSELFAWLQQTAGIDDFEMNRTFNNGIGMVVVIDANRASACAEQLRQGGETVYQIGVIAPINGGGAVEIGKA